MPEHPFPAARDDALAVYRALAATRRVLVVGESAGGNLALGVVLSAAADNLPQPLSVALLSPWLDLAHTGDSHASLAGLDPALSVEHFLQPASLAYAGGPSPRSSKSLPKDLPPHRCNMCRQLRVTSS